MKILTKKEVLEAVDIKIIPVETPEWGEGTGVCVKEMSGIDRDHYASWLAVNLDKDSTKPDTPEQRTGLKMTLLSLTMCDEAGNPLFTQDDVKDLMKKSATALARVFVAAMDVNGMSRTSQEAIRKNSERASDGNGSASPVVSECPSPEPSEK